MLEDSDDTLEVTNLDRIAHRVLDGVRRDLSPTSSAINNGGIGQLDLDNPYPRLLSPEFVRRRVEGLRSDDDNIPGLKVKRAARCRLRDLTATKLDSYVAAVVADMANTAQRSRLTDLLAKRSSSPSS